MFRGDMSIQIDHAPIAVRARRSDILVIEHDQPGSPLSPISPSAISPISSYKPHNQSVNQSYNLSINQPFNQSINQSFNHYSKYVEEEKSEDQEVKVDLDPSSPLIRIVSAPITKNEIQLRATEAVLASFQQVNQLSLSRKTNLINQSVSRQNGSIQSSSSPKTNRLSSAFIMTKRGTELLSANPSKESINQAFNQSVNQSLDRDVSAATLLSFLADHKRSTSQTQSQLQPVQDDAEVKTASQEEEDRHSHQSINQSINYSINQSTRARLQPLSLSQAMAEAVARASNHNEYDSLDSSPLSSMLAPSPSLEAAFLALARTPSPGPFSNMQYSPMASSDGSSRSTTGLSYMPHSPPPLLPFGLMQMPSSHSPQLEYAMPMNNTQTLNSHNTQSFNQSINQSNQRSSQYVSQAADEAEPESGANRFKCPECSKPFPSNSALSMHVLVHSGEKPFQCLHCTKRFRQRGHLASHIRKHTGEKPYHCAMVQCGKQFKDKSGLNSHIRKAHSGNYNAGSVGMQATPMIDEAEEYEQYHERESSQAMHEQRPRTAEKRRRSPGNEAMPASPEKRMHVVNPLLSSLSTVASQMFQPHPSALFNNHHHDESSSMNFNIAFNGMSMASPAAPMSSFMQQYQRFQQQHAMLNNSDYSQAMLFRPMTS